jgi:hypothetical protein
MIDTDDLDNMSRRDLVELLEAYNESLAEVKRLRDKALVFDTIYDWYESMQLQSESYENELWRMDWLLKNPTKEYEDYDKEYDEE